MNIQYVYNLQQLMIFALLFVTAFVNYESRGERKVQNEAKLKLHFQHYHFTFLLKPLSFLSLPVKPFAIVCSLLFTVGTLKKMEIMKMILPNNT